MIYIKRIVLSIIVLGFFQCTTFAMNEQEARKQVILQNSKFIKELPAGKSYLQELSNFYNKIDNNPQEIIKIQQRLLLVLETFQNKKVGSQKDYYTKMILEYIYFRNIYSLEKSGIDSSEYTIHIKKDSTIYTNLQVIPSPSISTQTAQELLKFPAYNTTIRNELNPQSLFPENQYFTATKYLSSSDTVLSETRDKREIEDREIFSTANSFSYYASTIEISQAGMYEFYNDSSFASVSFILNDRVLLAHQQNNSPSVIIYLDPGKYRLEFEHKSTSTPFSYRFGYTTGVEMLSKTDLIEQKYISKATGKDSVIWYVGVYRSDNLERNIYVNVQKSNIPVTLLLRAYESVNWKIINPYNTEIDAIYYAASDSSTTLTGHDTTTQVNKIVLTGVVITSLDEPKCEKIEAGGTNLYYCDNDPDNLGIFKSYTSELWDVPRGFSGKYATSEIQVPEMMLDNQKYNQLEELYEKHKKIRDEYDTTGLY